MDVRCLVVPYDSGQRHMRMGRGPEKLLEGTGWLWEPGTVETEWIEAAGSFPEEIAGTFGLVCLLAERVRAAVAAGRFPLVLAGNCFAAVGVLAGLSPVVSSVFWFDCHGDFNTPETTSSGFLDGMGLATALGLCWSKMAAAIPCFRAVPGRHVAHVGGRDFDQGEREMMEQAGIAVLGADMLRQGIGPDLASALAALARSTDGAYVHIDLDVLDPNEAPANVYQKPGGLTVTQLDELLDFIGAHVPGRAAAFTAYDPAYDPLGRTSAAAQRLRRRLVANAAARAPRI